MNIPRVSFTVMEKQMTQMLRFKVKTTPKRTVRKMLQALFLQHFDGFILHGTFVVCQEIYIIFSKINFFSFGVLLLFCCYSKCTARNRQYIRLKVAPTKVKPKAPRVLHICIPNEQQSCRECVLPTTWKKWAKWQSHT